MNLVNSTETQLGNLLKSQADFNLAEAALLIALFEYPHLEIPSYLKKLDEMAEMTARSLAPKAGLMEKVGGINRHLFGELQFRGNRLDYYNPKNSYLNDVIDYKTGIPITLSVIYLTTAWKLGLPLYGVGFPGHFLVGCKNLKEDFFIDPFSRGKILKMEDLVPLYESEGGEAATFNPAFLQPVSKKQIVCRLLNNLKAIYLLKKDFIKALTMISHILLCADDVVPELKQRGLLALSLECYQVALHDFEEITRLAPEDADLPFIREQIELLRERVNKMM